MKLNIQPYNKIELEKLLENKEFWKDEIIPISKQRIISQLNNPYLSDEDTLLILAFDNNKIIGYIGLLPTIYKKEDFVFKYYWGTTWWISDNYHKTGIGVYLLMSAFEQTKNRFSAIAFTESAGLIYANYSELQTITNQQGYDFQFLFSTNRKKNIRFFKKIYIFLQNSISSYKLAQWNNKNSLQTNNYEFISYIDEQIISFVNEKQKNEITFKSKDYFNWILKYPWVLQSPLEDALSSKYFFSYNSEKFHFFCFKTFNKKSEISSFVILRLRDAFLTVPFIYFEKEALPIIVNIIWKLIFKLKISAFTTYNHELYSYITKNNIPFARINYFQRPHVLSKEISKNISEYELQDGDGDAIFT